MMATVYLLIPNSQLAKEWIENNVSYEPWQKLGQNLAIEHRYAEDVFQALVEDGLVPGQDFDFIK